MGHIGPERCVSLPQIPKKKNPIYRILMMLFLSAALTSGPWKSSAPLGVSAVLTSISVTPSNTLGVSLGQLSLLQFVLMSVLFLKFVVLNAAGVLPVSVDFVDVWEATRNLFVGRRQDAAYLRYELVTHELHLRDRREVSPNHCLILVKVTSYRLFHLGITLRPRPYFFPQP